MEGIRFFSYTPGKSLLHKIPPSIKVVLMPLLSVLAFVLPSALSLIFLLFCLLFSVIILKFSRKDIISTLKPLIAYFFILEIISIVLNLISEKNTFTLTFYFFLKLLRPSSDFLKLFLHISLSLEISSLFYRTTSITEFNEGFSSVEQFFTRKTATPFADMLSLTITFIPRLALFWQKINYAWKARNGKNSIRKIFILTPILFRVGMHEAWQKALSRENRK